MSFCDSYLSISAAPLRRKITQHFERRDLRVGVSGRGKEEVVWGVVGEWWMWLL
jgi:hypothetical protein